MKVKLMMKIKDKDDEMGDIAQFHSNGFTFVAELINCDINKFENDKEYDVHVIFFCHELYGIYKTPEEFHEHEHIMNEESIIPVGAFPADPNDKNWKPSPMNYINSVVEKVIINKDYDIPENLLCFDARALQQIGQVIHYDSPEEKYNLQPGYIVSGLYWAELRMEADA